MTCQGTLHFSTHLRLSGAPCISSMQLKCKRFTLVARVQCQYTQNTIRGDKMAFFFAFAWCFL